MKNRSITIAGGVISMLMASSIYFHLKRRQQDRQAAQVLQALHRIIKPATVGLLSEESLDIHYLDDLLKRINHKVLVLNEALANQFAERIQSAWGAWYQGGDDEAKVYAVFRSLKDKVQVAQVAKAYQDNYGENLIEKLQQKFDEEEIKTLLNIISPLPKYTPAKRDKGGRPTKTGRGIAVSIPNWNNPYDQAYTAEVKAWISPQRIYELHPKDADKLAVQLKQAYGGAWYANDDEEAVKAVFFKMLKDKVQVSGLAKFFWNKYQKDLWEHLSGFLSKREMEKYVHQPVRKLPNYRIVKQ